MIEQIRQNNRGINAIFVHSLIDDAGLDVYSFRVLMHLSRRANKGVAWPGIDNIAAITLMSRNKVIESLKILHERKMIVKHQAKGHGNRHVYELTSAEDWLLEEPQKEIEKEPESKSPGEGLSKTKVHEKDSESPPEGLSFTREGDPVEGDPDLLSQSAKRKVFGRKEAALCFFRNLPKSFGEDKDFPILLAEFLAERWKKRKPMTEVAVRRMVKKWDGFDVDEVNEALGTATTGGYQGVFPKRRHGKPDAEAEAKIKERMAGHLQEADPEELDKVFGKAE